MTNLIMAAALTFLTATGPVTQSAPAAQPTAAAQDQGDQKSDRAVNVSQPDFTIIGLPTTLRMPRFASAFRVTHRFTRPLGSGDFGDLASDLFGLDSSAQIGLEYRFGIMTGTQIGIHRTSDQTIEFFAQYHLLDESKSPVGMDIFATAEGTNNFKDSYSPGIGVVVSRTLGKYGALYAHPMWINNTNSFPSEIVEDNDTVIVGVGGRVRIRPTVYIVAEAVPRFGYEPDSVYTSFGIEKRVGGHVFQLNFSNGFGTTMAQLARGGVDHETWYLGFNISRKFF
jgi:Membrane bound beta barrel domain (DUF5777)